MTQLQCLLPASQVLLWQRQHILPPLRLAMRQFRKALAAHQELQQQPQVGSLTDRLLAGAWPGVSVRVPFTVPCWCGFCCERLLPP